ncbi:hypothetical protein OIV83_003625 [Microbotryomycetes sp. JL201]|nr:hypothetical protein OIV83_003625 [Microbotryomycetes sp. JL201]
MLEWNLDMHHKQLTPSDAVPLLRMHVVIRLRPETSPPSSTPSTASPTNTPPTGNSPVAQTPAHLPAADGAPDLASSGPSVEQSRPASHEPQQPASTNPLQPQIKSIDSQLEEFFSQDWTQKPGTKAEILFIKRATRSTDKWSGHVAFPGGRQEPEDEDSRYTAMRETWEEVGLDLAESNFLSIGALDDREITTSLGKRLLMILSPHVFLHTSPYAPMPELQESEVSSAHWVSIEKLTPPQAQYGNVSIDISTRLAPRNMLARFALKMLVGSMNFTCILLPNEPIAVGNMPPRPPKGHLPELKLWGLTLGMTLDLLSSMKLPDAPPSGTKKTRPGLSDLSTYPHAISTLDPNHSKLPTMFAPSMASIFPRFAYPDINLLIAIFGTRYRRTLQTPAHEYARVNWQGMSISSYYAAVRRALVVAVVLRALAALSGLSWLVVEIRRRVREKKGVRAAIGM